MLRTQHPQEHKTLKWLSFGIFPSESVFSGYSNSYYKDDLAKEIVIYGALHLVECALVSHAIQAQRFPYVLYHLQS